MPYVIFKSTQSKWLKRSGDLIGYYIIHKDFRITPRTIFTMLLGFSTNIFGVTTIFSYEFEIALRMSALFTLVFQAMIKTILILENRVKIQEMWKLGQNIYRENHNKKATEHLIIMRKLLWRGCFVSKTLFCLYGGTAVVCICGPIFLYSFTRHWETAMPLYIPKLDPQTQTGGAISYVYQSVVLIMGSNGLALVDAYYALFVTNIFVMAKILQYESRSLNRKLTRFNNSNRDLFNHFRNICLMHKEISE